MNQTVLSQSPGDVGFDEDHLLGDHGAGRARKRIALRGVAEAVDDRHQVVEAGSGLVLT